MKLKFNSNGQFVKLGIGTAKATLPSMVFHNFAPYRHPDLNMYCCAEFMTPLSCGA